MSISSPSIPHARQENSADWPLGRIAAVPSFVAIPGGHSRHKTPLLPHSAIHERSNVHRVHASPGATGYRCRPQEDAMGGMLRTEGASSG